jgi:chitin disaccharide deacetylase
MAINPILHQLGFVDGERALILHADDLGMCQATLQAFAELVECGLICSGSVMVPCPSFPQIAAYCRVHPRIDMGVHLTLTSEFDSYRWGPVSTSDPASGLLDNEGYFPRWPERLHGAASPAAIELELLAQIRQALEAGIDVTHLDLHMGCLMHPDLLPLYLRLACETHLPALVWHPTPWPLWGFDAAAADEAIRRIARYQRQGQPVFDHLIELPLNTPQERLAQVHHVFDTLEPGLTLLYFHPAVDTWELRAITPDWPSRVADYEAFKHPAICSHLRQAGIHLLSYRQLQEARQERRPDNQAEPG